MTEDEAEQGYVLTCQMVPESDCIIRIPATSDVAKTEHQHLHGRDHLDRPAVRHGHRLLDQVGQPVGAWVPSGPVRQHPGTRVPTRPGRSPSAQAQVPTKSVFLIRNTSHGVLTTYLRDRAKNGDRIEFNGPLGSFYLREIKRPVLFLAGGTGLAPFLSMLDKIEADRERTPHTPDLWGHQRARSGQDRRAGGYAARIPSFSFTCCVAAEDSTYPNKGYVTRYMTPEQLNNGIVDVYLCGPPLMVDAVRTYLSDQGITPANFYYEKFSGTGVVSEIGESHVKVVDSDEAFDARMALELGAAQLVINRLTPEQLRVSAAGRSDGEAHQGGTFLRPRRFP